jgi:hypothetical protein
LSIGCVGVANGGSLAETQMFMALESNLYRRLRTTFGDDISMEILKELLYFSSVDAVVVAISKRHLTLPVFGNVSLRQKTVKTADLAAYIADQYVRSLNKFS